MREQRRFLLPSLAAGLVGAVLFVLAYLVDPRHALFSYLTVYSYVLSLALGSLVLLFIGNVTGARWFVVMRRAPELFTSAFPLLALLSLPLLLGLGHVYPWVSPDDGLSVHVAVAIQEKRSYLNVPFFWLRTLACFALWIAVAELLRRWSRAQDDDGDPAHFRRLSRKQRVLSAAALPPFAFALTFWSFDWIMSLTPAWYSNALGFYFFTGCFLAGVSLLIVVGERARFGLRLSRENEASLFHVAGKLLLVAVVLWAYIAFAQFFLMWITNLPEEVSWYLPRARGDWAFVSVALMVGHFALPFLALLSRPLKRHPRPLALVAAWLLAAHFLDVYWLIFPTLHPEGVFLDWTTPVALLAIGGLSVAFIAYRARGAPPIPRHDPLLEAGLGYRTP